MAYHVSGMLGQVVQCTNECAGTCPLHTLGVYSRARSVRQRSMIGLLSCVQAPRHAGMTYQPPRARMATSAHALVAGPLSMLTRLVGPVLQRTTAARMQASCGSCPLRTIIT